MPAVRSPEGLLIGGSMGSSLAFEQKTPPSLWRMNQSKKTDDGYTSNGTEFGAAGVRAWLLPYMKLDYYDFGSPEIKKVVLSTNDVQEKEEYLQQ